MHYLDIELGDEYFYHGCVVKVIGTRVLTHVGSGKEEYFVTITLGPTETREVQPHELSVHDPHNPYDHASTSSGCHADCRACAWERHNL
jgi:hypothetical protein